jgi:hypothetical protein
MTTRCHLVVLKLCITLFLAAEAHAQIKDEPTSLQWRSEIVPNLDMGAATVVDYEMVGYLVTASGAATPGVNAASPTVPGSPAFGVDTTGVARLFLDTDPAVGLGAICTGSLLSTGRHLLTAAHCVTDASGQLALLDGQDGNTATFDLPAGSGSIGFSAANVSVHPNWNGIETNGFDVAVIDLGVTLIPEVARYNLFTATDGSDFDVPVVKVGYGVSGDGSTGGTLAAGTQRAGLNRYESNAFAFLGHTNIGTQLLYDFDSGDPLKDAYGTFFGANGLLLQNSLFDDAIGFGTEEVGAAPGDSGGPSFLFNSDAGEWQIAGITSYGLSFGIDPDGNGPLAASGSDLVPGINSSFGEFGGDTRVAHPAIRSFIQASIPEPVSVALLLPGLLALVGRRR